MKRKLPFIFAITLLLSLLTTPAHAAITWSAQSNKDVRYDGEIYSADYDVDYLSVAIFDNSADDLYFYMNMVKIPTTNMFNDGKGSWGLIGLDYDFDNDADVRLEISRVSLLADRTSVRGKVWDARTKSTINCTLEVFTNIDESKYWVGFNISRKCINLPLSFNAFAYAEYNATGSGKSFDYAPYPFFRVNLPGSSTTTPTTTTTVASSGYTYTRPTTTANGSKLSRNYDSPPTNLSTLSDSMLPSVVTVKCSTGSGTGWSADVALSSQLTAAGFRSFLITNHHVVYDCLGNKVVTLVRSDGSSVAGEVVSWDETNDVAGIATKTSIPALQWIGGTPKQGWWVGVLGSPLGKANVLTTGIISSVSSTAKKFTITAAINPGNSGGPVFDNTGRVIGLATSKAVLSDGQLAEGFGTAHGVPLVCGPVVTCSVEPDPWAGVAKFPADLTEAELAAKAKAEAEAKAAAEAKAKAEAEAKAKAEAEAKAKAEAEAKLQEMANRCVTFNGDLELATFKVKDAMALYPKSSSRLIVLLTSAPTPLNCSAITIETFESQLTAKKKVLDAFNASATSAIASAKSATAVKTTITCVKGSVVKKVTAVNPKCPTGYKIRK